ncbi:hypothetical protein DAPPUDRAFT_310726 [Daphnia pulex]|uniref:Uncharacterized protein n=1 Tax=Daphnia pulex TaxID=6669 RepID=E9FVB2_DAPPU|nr:hypothetical protein DAPPUDRAFT_310726 [Daphnia pulex]|eukprot:EFX89142.1 hypothetical protein DAPPUDRAFT_310726 [Daphnia pulex]
MRPQLASLLILSVVICLVSAENQSTPNNDPAKEIGNPQPSFTAEENDERFFVKTVSLTLSTTTSTTTRTKTLTCSTSTAGLSVCTASGRRRRGLHLSGNKEGRGLFYNENEELAEEGSIFLPSPAKEETEPVKSKVEPSREVRKETSPVPFVVQPGFNAPAGQGRVLLYFGTSTVTTTSTTTTTTSITAICQSTTGYPVCGSKGK